MTEWISVKDAMPGIGKDVLIYHFSQIDIARLQLYDDVITWQTCKYSKPLHINDHWMPLPEAPHVER